MSKIVLLGATGSLGKHLLHQAVKAGHEVTVLVRTPAKLPSELRGSITVIQADLATIALTELTAAFSGQDAVINTAGLVTEGPGLCQPRRPAGDRAGSRPRRSTAGVLVHGRRRPAGYR